MTSKLRFIHSTQLIGAIKERNETKEVWLFEIDNINRTVRVFQDDIEMGTFQGEVFPVTVEKLEALADTFKNVRTLQ